MEDEILTKMNKFSDLKQRTNTTFWLIIGVSLVLILGNIFAIIAFTSVHALLIYEWLGNWWTKPNQHKIAVSIISSLLLLISNLFFTDYSLIILLSLTIITLFFSFEVKTLAKKFWFGAGLLYIGLFPISTINLFVSDGLIGFLINSLLITNSPLLSNHMLESYLPYLPWIGLYVISLVITVDIAGYFGGRIFGGFKLAVNISPGKTWSGVISSLVFCLIVFILWQVFGGEDFHSIILLPTPAFNFGSIALFAIVGDLFQSYLKRKANIKDSGNMLPGHGGIFDRLDGFIGACAIAWFTPLFI